MKNKEKYIDEFIDASCHDDICGFVNKHRCFACYQNGADCEKCKKELKKWLEQEYNPEPRLSHDEYTILKNVDDLYNWITRDCDKELCLYSHEPSKETYCWKCKGLSIKRCFPFTSNFQFIKWEDKEPYNIQELLDEYEKYYEKNK